MVRCPVADLPDMKPCPFCGIALAVNDNRRDFYVRRYGTHYQHPVTDCYLSDTEVTPSQVGEWNRRADVSGVNGKESDRG